MQTDAIQTWANDSPPATAESNAAICDERALSEFIRGRYRQLYAWFRSMCRDDARAADLTQATFAAFVESRARRKIERPTVWLFRIGRNLWRADCRLRKRETIRVVHNVASMHSEEFEPSPTAPEKQNQIRAAVGQLPSALRDVIVLRYWSQLSHAEIAGILRRPQPLIRWRLHQAKKHLQKQLNESGLFDGGES